MIEKSPPAMIERPKMPRATWDALRSHIIRERLRKKQEHEQNQEVRLLNEIPQSNSQPAKYIKTESTKTTPTYLSTFNSSLKGKKWKENIKRSKKH